LDYEIDGFCPMVKGGEAAPHLRFKSISVCQIPKCIFEAVVFDRA
jgi:hypothetical protein